MIIMKVLKQSMLVFLFWSVLMFFQSAAGLEFHSKPRRPIPVRPIASPISYDGNVTTNGLYLEIGSYQWKRVTKIDQRRRWRLNMSASHPIQLYLLDPRLKVGNPPDRVKLNSWAQRKWIQVEDIVEDKFLPFGNEAAFGGNWNIYLYNPSKKAVKVKLFVDTSGKPTAEERKKQPLFFALLLLLTGGASFLMYKLLKWRKANPLKDASWG
jgi:hypothetical protein